MSDFLNIVAAVDAAHSRNETPVLATIVEVTGSSYRRPGARMVVLPDGQRIGAISGGCLEADVAEHAAVCSRRNGPELLSYDTSDARAWGLGMGCNGVIKVLLEPVSASGAANSCYQATANALRQRQACMLATVYAASFSSEPVLKPGDRLLRTGALSTSPCANGFRRADLLTAVDQQYARQNTARYSCERPGASLDLLLEYLSPQPALVVVGAGDDAIPVASAGHAVGWDVTVLDRRPEFAIPARFNCAKTITAPTDKLLSHISIDDHTFVIIMTHSYQDDLAALRQLLPLENPYIGLLGPERRKQRLLNELRTEGRAYGARQLHRLRAPAGLDTGAETPAEIAASIMAEMLAVRAGRTGAGLTERRGAIHDPTQSIVDSARLSHDACAETRHG